jgi:hypothetical protein
MAVPASAGGAVVRISSPGLIEVGEPCSYGAAATLS